MMLYKSTLVLIKGGSASNLAAKYTPLVGESLQLTMPRGSLDVLLMKTPQSIVETERIVRELYEILCREAPRHDRRHVRTTVLVDGLDIEYEREQAWEVMTVSNLESELPRVFRTIVPSAFRDLQFLPVMVLGNQSAPPVAGSKETIHKVDEYMDGEVSQSSSGKLLNNPGASHNVVAVGGTFDHLHAGHKLLLTVAGFLAKECLIVGVTGPELLKNKKYAEAMESYTERVDNVRAFINRVFPCLDLETEMIYDIYGPTATVEAIDALVVSKETRSGGDAVNKFRLNKGWHALKVYEVDLIGGSSALDKLSSTELRKKDLDGNL